MVFTGHSREGHTKATRELKKGVTVLLDVLKSCVSANTVFYESSFTSTLGLFWQFCPKGHMLSQNGPSKTAMQKPSGHISRQHFNPMYCALEKHEFKATETTDYFNAKSGKSFWLKICLMFKAFQFDTI